MKPPAAIIVGPHTYGVEVVPEIPGSLLGEADHCTLTIRVVADLPDSVTAEVVLHELLHCLIDQGPLRDFDSDVEESIVSALAPPLLDALRRNPKLVALLAP